MKTKSAQKLTSASTVTGGVLCGTDFSAAAELALDVSTDFARRVDEPLILAHALELPRALKGDVRATRWLAASRKRSLREMGEGSRQRGVEVLERVGLGRADEVLLQTADSEKARMIVVSSRRDRRPARWLRRSVVERIAGRGQIPTLMLRNAEPVRAW